MINRFSNLECYRMARQQHQHQNQQQCISLRIDMGHARSIQKAKSRKEKPWHLLGLTSRLHLVLVVYLIHFPFCFFNVMIFLIL